MNSLEQNNTIFDFNFNKGDRALLNYVNDKGISNQIVVIIMDRHEVYTNMYLVKSNSKYVLGNMNIPKKYSTENSQYIGYVDADELEPFIKNFICLKN